MLNDSTNSKFSDLQPLLNPRTIAVVGASPDPRKAISQYVDQLLKNGYKGKIYPVNPKYENLHGYECYKSLLDIPEDIDIASIAIKSTAVLGTLGECVEKGVKAAIVFSSGFAEIGGDGKRMQEDITALACRTGMRILGPNCNGIMNINDRVVMSLFFITGHKELIPGDIALISQSGTVPVICLAIALERGIGYRCLVSVGNEADLEISDFIGYMVNDHQTKVITGYVEGFKNVKKFIEAAELALTKKKPIVLLHAARYTSSLTAAEYHTGASTEPGYDFETIFREKCIITVNEPEELIEFGSLFSYCNIPLGDGIGILNTSGGLTVLMADISQELNLNLPDYSKETRAMLAKWLKFGTVNNPMDLTGQAVAELELYENVLKLFVEEENFDILIISLSVLLREIMEYRVNKTIEISKQTDKPILVLWPRVDIGGDFVLRLIRNRIPVFRTFRSCLKAAKALIRYSQLLKQRDL